MYWNEGSKTYVALVKWERVFHYTLSKFKLSSGSSVLNMTSHVLFPYRNGYL